MWKVTISCCIVFSTTACTRLFAPAPEPVVEIQPVAPKPVAPKPYVKPKPPSYTPPPPSGGGGGGGGGGAWD